MPVCNTRSLGLRPQVPSHLLLPSAQDIEIFSRLVVSYHLRCTLKGHIWPSLLKQPPASVSLHNSLIISLPCFLHCLAHIIMQNYLFPYSLCFSPSLVCLSSSRNLEITVPNCNAQDMQVFNYHLEKTCPIFFLFRIRNENFILIKASFNLHLVTFSHVKFSL